MDTQLIEIDSSFFKYFGSLLSSTFFLMHYNLIIRRRAMNMVKSNQVNVLERVNKNHIENIYSRLIPLLAKMIAIEANGKATTAEQFAKHLSDVSYFDLSLVGYKAIMSSLHDSSKLNILEESQCCEVLDYVL